MFSVIIPAFNAETFIGAAIASALLDPLAKEVIVVDDCSADRTADLVQELADDEPRLKLFRLQTNGGPGRARNHAIAQASQPWIALLDADDRFAPGRLQKLRDAAGDQYDLFADGIVFEEDRGQAVHALRPRSILASTRVGLNAFIMANVPKSGQPRHELGFLKPVIRKEFLDSKEIKYHEHSFGEDFSFYIDCLLAGGRFGVLDDPMYIATLRGGSLSHTHSSSDLARLRDYDLGLLQRIPLDAKQALTDHLNHLSREIAYRELLVVRRRRGIGAAIVELLKHPSIIPVAVLNYARKIRRLRRQPR